MPTPSPGQTSPGQRPPLDTDPLEGTWDQAARQEVTSYGNPAPRPLDRMTDMCENITLPQLRLRAITSTCATGYKRTHSTKSCPIPFGRNFAILECSKK